MFFGEKTGGRNAAFTLIELLIVIAIIAILALIAVPNFLEAQVRAKVSRVMADQRSLATALEAYAVDWGALPHVSYNTSRNHQDNRGGIHMVTNLTTPVGYITSVNITDPFCKSKTFDQHGLIPGTSDSFSIHYVNIPRYMAEYDRWGHWANWVLISLGPDYIKGPNAVTGGGWLVGSYARVDKDLTQENYTLWYYDATNGTISGGDILRWNS